MKKTLLLTLVSIPLFIGAQGLLSLDTSKFAIHLPDYWKHGSKIWQILNDKLPTVSEELKDKELCGDNCHPKFSIEFEMSEPEMVDYYSNHISTGKSTETWEIVTLYSFSSSLLMFDEQDKLITRFILVDKTEIWRVKHMTELPSFLPTPPQRIYMYRDPNSRQVANDYARNQPNMIPTVQGQSPYTYINNNKEKLSPTQRDMLGIIDDKIRSW